MESFTGFQYSLIYYFAYVTGSHDISAARIGVNYTMTNFPA